MLKTKEFMYSSIYNIILTDVDLEELYGVEIFKPQI
jgi:hypothetical protein